MFFSLLCRNTEEWRIAVSNIFFSELQWKSTRSNQIDEPIVVNWYFQTFSSEFQELKKKSTDQL